MSGLCDIPGMDAGSNTALPLEQALTMPTRTKPSSTEGRLDSLSIYRSMLLVTLVFV